MITDEIIEEVRANREAHAARFNYDLRAIYEDLKKSERERISTEYPFVEPPRLITLSLIKQLSTNKSLYRTTAPLPTPR